MEQIIVNPIAAMMQGQQLAAQSNDMRRQNALAQLYRQNGAGIASGDPQALNALAQIDPMAARQITQQQQAAEMERQRFGMERERLDMAREQNAFQRDNTSADNARQDRRLEMDEERMNMIRDEAKAKAAEAARAMSAEEREREITTIETGLRGAIHFFEKGDQEGYDNFLRQQGLDPAQYPFEQFPAFAAQFDGVLGALKEMREMSAGPEPADEYQRYVQEERAAGRQPLGRIDFAQAKKGEGFTVQTPDGTTVRYGNSGKGESAVKPSSPEAMVATIDGILSDPALDTATGVFSPLQMVPGTPQRRFGARTKQLEGQAFLQAFESLKGGGQITEIEGVKATQAIGRLDSAQSADDYRGALNELRDILVLAQQRPIGWAYKQESPELKQGNMPAVGAVEDGYVFLGGDPARPESWQKVR